ncbi:hypothetical protein K461DRAFT_282445 [Myriangium duriaei CBS 260.36]|uniref:2EXR domain-containing protein n=1 Tax=Myriangium duriaei CBS 260.36 TaxID=1168546 RepID=A0A9P4MCP5_9PEZI|nr:hypothetical protein K461DRAFT_282445 [Myriangium duriaei CBS 260.36]
MDQASLESGSLSTFPRFPDLPLEIRLQIWREALPLQCEPALHNFVHVEQYWATRPSIPGYMDFFAEAVPIWEFQHDLLKGVRYDVPFARATREARRVALDWAHERKMLPTCSRESKTSALFARAFEPKRDVVYVADGDWHLFMSRPRPDTYFYRDIHSRPYRSAIKHVAIHMENFEKTNLSELQEPDLLKIHPRLESLYIVNISDKLDLFQEVERVASWDSCQGCFDTPALGSRNRDPVIHIVINWLTPHLLMHKTRYLEIRYLSLEKE